MRANFNNLSLVLFIGMFFTLGCAGEYKNIADADAPKVERGRLKFAKSVKYLNIGWIPVYHEVRQGIFVSGQSWSPDGDNDFARKLYWCDTSPNPAVEVLICYDTPRENQQSTFILRMKNEQPELQRIDESQSFWVDADGRWLLFKKLFLNVENGEKIEIKGLSNADRNDGADIPNVIAISPGRQTIITLPDRIAKKEGGEEFLTLRIIDAASGKTEQRKVSFTKNPYLEDSGGGAANGSHRAIPGASKKIVWEKDAQGREQPVFQK
jgi:hypothetical protein